MALFLSQGPVGVLTARRRGFLFPRDKVGRAVGAGLFGFGERRWKWPMRQAVRGYHGTVMSTSEKPSTRGFGPVALVVTGVVCFAAGYMVSDATKALTQPEGPAQPAHGGAVTPPPSETSGLEDRTPAPEAAPGGAGSVPGGAGADPKKEEPKGGAGVPEGSGSAPGASVPPPAPK